MSNDKKLKFLFVAWESLSGDLAWQLTKEGHEVKMYIKSEVDKDVFDGFVLKVEKWEPHVDWADVVIFDDVGFGEEAEKLRKAGKRVVGGSIYTDKLEENREFGQEEMKRVGMTILPHWDFDSYDTALKFIKENPGRYVYKPSGYVASDWKGLLFLGAEEDGKDLHEILRHNKKTLEKKIKTFQLQKSATGVEIAVGAFFNGKDFIYPVCVNFEHKKLFPGNIGPFVGDMGALMYWSQANTIFKMTLEKMKEDLIKSGYVGYVDINCIANARGIYPLEFTCFSDDTEILTKEGWKLIKEVRHGEVVATLNPRSHALEYQSVTGTIAKKYEGSMVHISGAWNSHEALDCLVTPDHEMYVQQRNGRYGFVRADAIPQGSKIKRASSWNGEEVATYTVPGYVEQHVLGRHEKTFPIEHPPVIMPMDVWLRFLGIFLAEGSIGGRGYLVSISQYVRRPEVRQLLEKFPFHVAEYAKGFQISSAQLVRHLLSYNFGKSNEKYVPLYVKSLASRQMHIFLDAFRIGDGSIHRRTGQRSYFSTSARLIDDLQELLLKCGIVGNIRRVKSKGTRMIGTIYRRNHDIYFLTERTTKQDYYIDKRNIRSVSYRGRVYCVEVPNHIIYVRRNGKAFWCGNCRFGYPTISVQIEGVTSNWGEFLHTIAGGEQYDLKTKKGFQLGIICAVPPFPYDDKSEMAIYQGLSILFKKENFDGIHLGDVRLDEGDWRVAGETGYVIVVTGAGSTVEEARKQAYGRLDNVMLQNMFYRTDVGGGWAEDSDHLQTWGYLY